MLLKKSPLVLMILAAMTLVAMLGAPPARAQASGTTAIDIDFPPLVVLWYFSSVNVDVSPAALAGALVTGATGDEDVDEGAKVNQAAFSPDLAISPSLDGDPSALVLTLQNSWAVLSVGSSGGGNTQVDVALTDGTLTEAGSGDEILLANLEANSPNAAGWGDPIDFPPTGFNLLNLEVGDLRMDVDVRDATVEGNYAGGELTITASNL